MISKPEDIVMKVLMMSVFVLPIALFYGSIQASHAAQSLDKVVAVVNEDVITESELEKEVLQLRQQMMAQHAPMTSDTALKKQVLQQLINMNLQLQVAKQNNIKIDDADLQEALNRIATANHISTTQLRETVGQQGLAWDTFKETIRKQVIISRLQQQAVANDIMVTPDQIEAYLKNPPLEASAHLTFHLENLRIALPENPSAKDINAAQRLSNELISKIKPTIDFASLAQSETGSTLSVEAGDLGERPLSELPEIFAERAKQMQPGEVAGPLRTGNGFQIIRLLAIKDTEQHEAMTQFHLRQILLKADANMTEKETNQQVTNIYQQLKAGKDFAEMAKKYSLDAKSANNGGDLGWVHPGELPPELEETITTLSTHQVSKPVRSKLGWHLIEVLERRQVQDVQFLKKQQAWQYLQQKKFTEAIQNWQKNMQATAYIQIMEKELA